MRKSLLLLIILLLSCPFFAQIKGVKYMMKSGFYSNTFDVYIVITDGSATSNVHRSQFNAQISIVTPKEVDQLTITNYMPLQGNVNYSSTTPTVWIASLVSKAPSVDPEHSYFSIVPFLSPSSQYNNLKAGDVIKLFSFKTNLNVCYDEVRFYKNGVDPNNLFGADLTNGFTIGQTLELFKGIEEGMAEITSGNTLCEKTIVELPYASGTDNNWQISNQNKLKIENNKMIPLEAGVVNIQYKNGACNSPVYSLEITEAPFITLVDNTIVASENIGNFKWYTCNDDVLIIESNDGVFTPQLSGSYYAEITTDVCKVKTDCVDYVLSSTSETANVAVVYPSISTEKFYVKLQKGSYQMEVYDMDGKLKLLKQHLQRSEVESFGLSSLNNGLYLLKFSGPSNLAQKVIISNN